MKHHYDLLGVDRFVTNDELRQRYRDLAREWHPDKLSEDLSEEELRHAHETMSAVNEAYRVLADPNLRAAYDRELAEGQARSHDQHESAVHSKNDEQRSKPLWLRTLLALLLVAFAYLIYQNHQAPNRRNFNQEFGAAQTLFKPQVDRALKGDLPSLDETLKSPEGYLLKKALAPDLSPESCLEAFPKQLQRKP